MPVTVLVVSLLAVLASISSTNAAVDTTSGKVKGGHLTSTAGNNRWKAPQDREKWNGTKAMSTFRPSSPQSDTTDTISEDYLPLNVSLPLGMDVSSSLPVYWWIYGGLEAASVSDLSTYCVIQIGANYRKAIFDYLGLEELSADSSCNSSGNYGFLDHIKVLEWIRDNIANFGGDTQRVMIGGQSAGSAATQQLLYSHRRKACLAARSSRAVSMIHMTPPHDSAFKLRPITCNN
ncbi:alpha/beta-hydrolase [Acephala macrosclerotiorum]|nr:alpha/beta-hydrolase [Acephala macrosclerotiorum]